MELILLVEDDEKIAGNVTLRLRAEGYGVVAFRNSEDALAHLRDSTQVQPDMALLDVRLPGMSGIDLIRTVGDAMPPAIVISGEASMAETVSGGTAYDSVCIGWSSTVSTAIGRKVSRPTTSSTRARAMPRAAQASSTAGVRCRPAVGAAADAGRRA